MKKFCPNCGKPVKDTDNVCGNCGYELKKKETNNSPVNRSVAKGNIAHSNKKTLSNTRASYMEKNHNPKHNKTIMWICGGVLAAVIIGGGIFAGHQYVSNKNAEVKTTQSSKPTTKKATPATKKNQESNHQNSSEYSNDEWMMMGYIAYKAKDSGTTQAIDDVKNYFSDGELTAHKNSSTSYTLSNEYGSVDVDVKDDEVVVSNDGTSTFSKDTLKKSFSNDLSTIKSLVSHISSSSDEEATSNNESGNWKSGVARDIVGEYASYKDESEESKLATFYVYDLRSDGISCFHSNMSQSFGKNVKYQKIGKDKYNLKFDEKVHRFGTGSSDSENIANLTFEKNGDKYFINGNQVYKQSSTKFTLPSSPEDD
ncbi:zinc-ribbon domain-containing protein [Lactobacillus rodentium]|uniref:Zinc-ribbon domain-containing protein n=1 Tax=Lactobacillus rodentium TaxID=947835 RepID=A0A2Z6TA06_9LACO|nr:zinc ribbon domain-containing protein [Lactobacillus rodentium]MCR1894354.1 zinc-ribbon domain-containing protein [Lactobacillus rodentium]GBG04653.1 hypothetical protein LrDSM24759_05670 [Lactobacillus rodentium]